MVHEIDHTSHRKTAPIAYFSQMSFDFCLPTKATTVPDTPDWLHEVKYDGYRLRLDRDGDQVSLITRNSHNWTDRYPWIVEAALKNRIRQFVIDGEAVVLGVDGVADFNALHSRRHDEVQLYAFGGAADHEDIGKRSTIDVVAGGAVNTTVSGWLKSENERRAEGHKVKKALFP